LCARVGLDGGEGRRRVSFLRTCSKPMTLKSEKQKLEGKGNKAIRTNKPERGNRPQNRRGNGTRRGNERPLSVILAPDGAKNDGI